MIFFTNARLKTYSNFKHKIITVKTIFQNCLTLCNYKNPPAEQFKTVLSKYKYLK